MSKNNDISVFCGATLSALNLSIDQVWQKDDRVKITFELKRVMEEWIVCFVAFQKSKKNDNDAEKLWFSQIPTPRGHNGMSFKESEKN